MNDYVFLLIIAIVSIAGGLYLLREARQWRRRRDGLLDVIQVVTNPDYTLVLVFENGEQRVFDMAPLMDKQPFCQLKGSGLFAQASVDYGPVVWPGNIDIAPERLYNNSRPA